MEKRAKDLKKEKEYLILKFLYAIILALLFPIIGSLILFYRAYKNINKKSITLYKKNAFSLVKDRRHKSGYRKDYTKTSKTPVIVKINEKEKKIALYKAIGYIIIGLIFIIVCTYVLITE